MCAVVLIQATLEDIACEAEVAVTATVDPDDQEAVPNNEPVKLLVILEPVKKVILADTAFTDVVPPIIEAEI